MFRSASTSSAQVKTTSGEARNVSNADSFQPTADEHQICSDRPSPFLLWKLNRSAYSRYPWESQQHFHNRNTCPCVLVSAGTSLMCDWVRALSKRGGGKVIRLCLAEIASVQDPRGISENSCFMRNYRLYRQQVAHNACGRGRYKNEGAGSGISVRLPPFQKVQQMNLEGPGQQSCWEGNSTTPRLNYSSKVLSTKIFIFRHLSLTHKLYWFLSPAWLYFHNDLLSSQMWSGGGKAWKCKL